MATEISRMVYTQDPLVVERQKLATEVQEKLGYGLWAKAVGAPGALWKALDDLGIQPMHPTRVHEYQAKKAKPGIRSSYVWAYGCFSAALGLLVTFLHSVYPTGWSQWGTGSGYMSFRGVYGLLSALGCIVFTIIACTYRWDDDVRYHQRLYEWKKLSLDQYTLPVPEHILLKAVQIKDKCPAAYFVVEYLTDHRHDYVPTPRMDPFLIVKTEKIVKDVYVVDESYYIDVWDEAEFEKLA